MAPPIRLKLSLERLAMVQVSAALWRSPCIIKRIKGFFILEYIQDFKQPLVQYVTDRSQKTDWAVIINAVKTLNYEKIPVSLTSQLMYIIEQMGMRIFEFLRDLAHKLLYYSQNCKYSEYMGYYIDNIVWTSIGTIDQVKIYMNRYNNPDTSKDYFMWFEACNNCLENCATELWSSLSEESKKNSAPTIRSTDPPDCSLVTYWQCKITDDPDVKSKLYEHNMEGIRRLGLMDEPIEIIMFRLSVNQENEIATKYFWELLTAEEKATEVVKCGETILERRCNYPYCFGTYCKRCCDLFCIMVMRMTPSDRESIFANVFVKAYDPFNAWVMLLNWPWENVFMSTLEQSWSCFSMFDCKFFINKFDATVYSMDKNYSLGETQVYHKSILYRMCLTSPRILKAHFISRYRELNANQSNNVARPRYDYTRRRRYKWLNWRRYYAPGSTVRAVPPTCPL